MGKKTKKKTPPRHHSQKQERHDQKESESNSVSKQKKISNCMFPSLAENQLPNHAIKDSATTHILKSSAT